jgi:hypothetical protein
MKTDEANPLDWLAAGKLRLRFVEECCDGIGL